MTGTVKEEAIKLRQNIDRVYEAGRKSFHVDYQNGGARTDYGTAYAGAGWNNDTFKPVYDIQPTNAYMIFRATGISGDLVSLLEQCGVSLDFSKATNTQYLFNASRNIVRVGIVDVTSSTNSVQMDNTFAQCTSLTTVDLVRINEKTKFNTSTFSGCSALTFVGFDGPISNSLYIQYSPSLTNECIQGIIDHLATVTTQQTLTLHADVVGKLTPEQILTITNKNWQVM